MASQGTGREVGVRLYMEGIHIKNGFVRVQASGGRNTPAFAQIELVPTNSIRHIMPGTWVHVFTTDPWDDEPAGDLSDYKLLFEGIVTGRGFTKTDDGRNFVIQCTAPEVFWTQAKQFWLQIGSANGDIYDQMAMATSGGYGKFGKVNKTGVYGYMSSKLNFSEENQENVEEKFIDTMVGVLDDIGNVNPYYTNVRNRFRITDRVLRAPAGQTSKLFQIALLGDFFEGLMGRQSGQSTLMESVNHILSAVFHEWTSILAPSYVEGRVASRDVFGNVKRTKKVLNKRGSRGRTKVELLDYEPARDKVVGSVMFKPHVYTIDPPSFNVLFPNMYDQTSYQENFLQETTRLSMRPQLPLVGAKATQGLLLQRPVEMEIFAALVSDGKIKTNKGSASPNKKRTPDGKYADSSGQAPTFSDYDWSTNEERIRGITYNFINMAPAPSAVTLKGQGKKGSDGQTRGGIPDYLKNVASYEYYKSKFASRQTSLQGPYNMRPVPGFPMVMLDDSDSNLNIVCYLDGVTHSIDAQGSAMTQYSVSYPRISGEVDYNQPKFNKGLNAENQLDLSLARNEDGSFDFESIFDNENQPPVPEWFDESWRNTTDLDIQYRSWFGEDAGVMQNRMFKNPGDGIGEAAYDAATEAFSAELETDDSLLSKLQASAGAALDALKTKQKEFEDILEENENISIDSAIKFLNEKYRIARGTSKEFEEASRFTKRSFTKIDEAFSFVGAAPRELADRISGDDSTTNRAPTFNQNPASSRVIDYKKVKMDTFIGDTSFGSGYGGQVEGDNAPIVEALKETPGILSEYQNRMSGAFPVFDTKIHTGRKASDQETRDATAEEESNGSDRARYDGRPLMFDFEFRIWQESLSAAGKTPTQEDLAEDAEVADYKLVDEDGRLIRPKTPEERKDATKQRLANIAAKKEREKNNKRRGKHDPAPRKCPNMKNKTQAPTGDGLDEGLKNPLPQPLSEKQVVDLRRFVVEAYQEELTKTRGFTG